MSTSWRAGLNDDQARAAGHGAGPLIVLAGPGTGKTRVIIARVARLIEEGAKPESILALAYNVKAAEEVRSRLAEAVGASVAGRVQAVTFHSFGNGLISRFGDWIGVRSERVIMDSAQSKRLLRRLIFDHDLYRHLAAGGREAGIELARTFIARCKESAKTPQEAGVFAKGWEKRLERNEAGLEGDALEAERQRFIEFRDGARMYALFDAECMQQGLMTFDDCLALPLRIFAERPTAAAIVRDEIKHIVVDEFQDQNRAQIELLRHIAPPANNPDLCVVGDDDQAIYGFRGADTRAFARFAEIWRTHEQVELTVNYRSGGSIIAASNAVIARCASRFAPEKKIEAAGAGESGVVEGVILEDDGHAGAVIASMIILDRRANPEKPFASYGVIARQNDDVEAAAAELERHGLPVSIRERSTAADEEGVLDLLAWVRLLTAPPSGGPGEAAMVQRLLARPPFSVASAKAREWRMAFERERSMSGRREGGSFVKWVESKRAEDAAVGRFVAMLEELRHAAVTQRAERVVFEIIRAADLGRSGDLEGRERARRIAALVRVVRFARTRQRFLDEPGDLGAFVRYYDDLDDKDKGFDPPGDERLDANGTDEADGRDAVQLMTGHKAKGLEFETVFAVKCRPGGFPKKKTSESDAEAKRVLPEEFSGRAEEEEGEEQRRLFYVACTRAERRLVLLAKKKGKGGKTIDYFNELTQQTAGLTVGVRAASVLLEEAGLKAGDDVPLDAGGAEHRREALVRVEMARVRQHAYSALHDASVAELPAAGLEEAKGRLGDAAGALHALECLRVKRALPLGVPGAYRERLIELAALVERSEPEAPGVQGMKPPLRLSYSMIAAYERCPACFHLNYVQGMPEQESAALNFGSMMHKVLERFYGEVREAEAGGRALPDAARLAQVCESTIREMWPASAVFDRAVLDQALAQAGQAHAALFDPSSNILEIERSVRFKYPDPDTAGAFHDFTAKIDRVDQAADGGMVVVDYKSGRGKKELREPEADDLQLCVYAMALPAMLGDAAVQEGALPPPPQGWAEYWILSESARGRIALGDLDLAGARGRIDEAIRGMLAGRFERNEKCTRDCTVIGMGA